MKRSAWVHAPSGTFLLSAVLLLCSACGINPKLRLDRVPGLNETAVTLREVPFYAQETNQCGPAALAGVLGASGVEILPVDLVPQVYLPGREGSLQIELLAATRRAGRLAYLIDQDPIALIREIDAGRPVLVLQNLRTPHFPAWHYAVVVGYRADSNHFILNSGADRLMEISAGKFMRTWNWADRWAMVALRPEEYPATVDPERYLQSVADFGAVAGDDRVADAWRSAAARWPERSWPYLALGNIAYSQGEFDRAMMEYRRGLERNPGDPALINNLASTLGATGCRRAARSVLEPVISDLPDGSGWRSVLAQTLAELSGLPEAEPEGCRGPASAALVPAHSD